MSYLFLIRCICLFIGNIERLDQRIIRSLYNPAMYGGYMANCWYFYTCQLSGLCTSLIFKLLSIPLAVIWLISARVSLISLVAVVPSITFRLCWTVLPATTKVSTSSMAEVYYPSGQTNDGVYTSIMLQKTLNVGLSPRMLTNAKILLTYIWGFRLSRHIVLA